MRGYLYLLNLFSLVCCAQLETAQWRFGYKAGLSFQGAQTNTVSTSSISAQFSSSGIADSLGNLLFYVRSGDLIYNKNNDTMANGFNIGGYAGGTQASIVVRKSGNLYYVLTYNDYNYYFTSPISPMINYAVVDMSLAAGLGSVVVSSQSISAVGIPFVGKLAVTKHCNQKDYWLLTHRGGQPGSNQYYAYLVTSSGISTTPVISSIGSNQPQGNYTAPGFFRGQHKFSPNGKKVAAIFNYRTVELYDFNSSTGTLSNVIKLDTVTNPTPLYNDGHTNARGIEFSSDGSKLYVAYAHQHPFLCQFNLCAGSASAIAASKTIISSDSINPAAGKFFDLQSAPNGKIFAITMSSVSLGVINNPNALGIACNYSAQAQPLGIISSYTVVASSGLPNFISSFFEQKPALPIPTGNIMCGNVNFSVPSLCAASGYSVTSYQWNFSDPLSSSNTSTLSNPSHQFSANGNYAVKLVLNYFPCGADTLKQIVSISGLPALAISSKTNICNGESALLTLSGATAFTINGMAVTQNTVLVQPSSTTVYTVIGINSSSGCSISKTHSINVFPCTAMEEQLTNPLLSLHPNPSFGIFTIELNDDCRITISDIQGNILSSNDYKWGKHVVTGNFQNGLYFLEAKTEKVTKTIKFVVIE